MQPQFVVLTSKGGKLAVEGPFETRSKAEDVFSRYREKAEVDQVSIHRTSQILTAAPAQEAEQVELMKKQASAESAAKEKAEAEAAKAQIADLEAKLKAAKEKASKAK